MTSSHFIDEPGIRTETADRVSVITIARPEKRNAMTGEMAHELKDALAAADADPTVRAVVITGEGEVAFCAGHDLREVREDPAVAGDPEANAAFTYPRTMRTPVIAAVNGAAYAAGFILALNCDLRVAGDNAHFGAVGARLGLVPVGGQLSYLLAALPYPAAFRMLSTAEPMYAEEARRLGFVSEVCAPADTIATAVELGCAIAKQSPAVVQAIKQGLSRTARDGIAAGEAEETVLAGAVARGPDGAEGIKAFFEGRAPEFSDLSSSAAPHL